MLDIISYHTLTLNEAVKLQFNSGNEDTCLSDALNNYRRGYREQETDEYISISQKIMEIKRTINNMDHKQHKYINGELFSKQLGRDKIAELEQLLPSLIKHIPYSMADLQKDICKDMIYVLVTKQYPYVLVTDIGDALIICYLDQNYVEIEAEGASETEDYYDQINEYLIANSE